MAYDPNLNTSGGFKNPMNNEGSCPDFSEWYQNEESFDLTNFMSSSANLELCSDDLFQNLFPPNSPLNGPDPKKDNLDFNDAEVENWYRSAPGDPVSACASACSSAAPSPVPANYYNTPPVTPQAERQRTASPHHLQFDGLTTPMSSSRFASLRSDESRNVPLHHHQNEATLSNEHQFVTIKEEPEHDTSFLRTVPMSVKTEMLGISAGGSSSSGTSLGPAKEAPKRSAPLDATVPSKKNKIPEKGTDEYIEKRKRNNIAVRRSRDKAKVRALETQKKVDELTSENEKLHKRVAELSHELTTLKKLLQALPHMSS